MRTTSRPCADHAVSECVRQRGRAGSHVVADHDPRRVLIAHEAGECAADLGDELFVEFLADQAAHVIRLDDTMDSRGGPGRDERLREERIT